MPTRTAAGMKMYEGGASRVVAGYVKPVPHPDSFDRVIFKRHGDLYPDRVRHRVRQANRIVAELRHDGVVVSACAFARASDREDRLTPLPKEGEVRQVCYSATRAPG